VEEAFGAARVELIKILLFAIPLLSIAAACLCLLGCFLPPAGPEPHAAGEQRRPAPAETGGGGRLGL
jgi:hypothetical protein